MEMTKELQNELKIVVATTVYEAHLVIEKDRHPPVLLYGIGALAKFLGTSRRTAQKYKSKLPYKQIGRKVIFEVDKVLKAMEGENNG